MKYRVSTFRDAGLESKWFKNRRGAPMIAARKTGGKWYVVDASMFKRMQEVGVLEAFDERTMLGDYFSIPA